MSLAQVRVAWILIIALAGPAFGTASDFPRGVRAIDPIRAECEVPGGRILSFTIEPLAGEGLADDLPGLAAYELRGSVRELLCVDEGRRYHPWKVALCELDGDCLPEIALGVFKRTRLDPVERRRLFIFDWTREDVLVPLWLGSRLSFELDDFAFLRRADGLDVLVAVEHKGVEGCVLRDYRWRGFGFLAGGDRMRVDGPCDPDSARQACIRMLETLVAPALPGNRADTRSWRCLPDREERGSSPTEHPDGGVGRGQAGGKVRQGGRE